MRCRGNTVEGDANTTGNVWHTTLDDGGLCDRTQAPQGDEQHTQLDANSVRPYAWQSNRREKRGLAHADDDEKPR